LLLHDGSVPLMNFLTTRHIGEWLYSLMLTFNAYVRQVNRSVTRQVVTDFSYAIILACLATFNRSMAILNNLSLAYKATLRQRTITELQSTTYVTLWMAYTIKSISDRLHCTEPSSGSGKFNLRRFTPTAFTALQHTDNLKDAQTLYRNMYM